MDISTWFGIKFDNYASNPIYYAKNLYVGNQLVTELIIPDGVASIGTLAFYGYNVLTSVEIPNSVISIGGAAFSGCSSLMSVTIGNNVTSIGGSAFYDCGNLTNIEIPNSVTSIGSYAFENSGLTSIDIPDSVITIGSSAFHDCGSLISVTIGNGVTSIEAQTFQACDSLTDITIGNSVASIGVYAFHRCDALEIVEIPDSVTMISRDAFFQCSNLAEITLFSKITTICEDALPSYTYDTIICGYAGSTAEEYADKNGHIFVDLDSPLVQTWDISVTENDSVTAKLYRYADKAGTYYLEISGTGNMENLASNGPWYNYRTRIDKIIISDGVTSIGAYAFYDCSSLTSIEIPDSVTSIGKSAFYNCMSLAKITFYSKTTTIYDSADTIHSTATIYGYMGSTAEAYATKYGRNFVALQSYDNCTFVGTNVTLGADITVNYYVNLDGANTGLKMRFTMNERSVVVDGESTGIVSGDLTRYVFRFVGVAPQNIGDNILAELFDVDGEREIPVLTKDNYSVKSYCETLLSYSASALGMTEAKYAAMQTLVADLLHYGAAAQEYTEYKTDDLVNVDAVGGSAFATLEQTDEELVGTAMEGISFYSATVYFDSVNTICVKIKADDIKKVSMLVCRNGVPVAIHTELSLLEGNIYEVETEEILATEFGDLFTFTVYVDGVQGQSFVYSVNSYVYSMQSDEDIVMANLAKATYNYGASAKRYGLTK